MKIYILLLCALVAFTIFSCKEKSNINSISFEIENLSSVNLQKEFLEEIYIVDQEVRLFETEMLEKFGFDSEEHQNSLRTMMKTDEINLKKIEAYFKKYGHPKLEIHGKEACYSPCMIIHHAPGGDEPRRRNFKYLFPAYENGDITDGSFTFYLNRMYFLNYNKRIEWNRPYRVEEELDTLFKSLNLDNMVNEVNY